MVALSVCLSLDTTTTPALTIWTATIAVTGNRAHSTVTSHTENSSTAKPASVDTTFNGKQTAIAEGSTVPENCVGKTSQCTRIKQVVLLLGSHRVDCSMINKRQDTNTRLVF